MRSACATTCARDDGKARAPVWAGNCIAAGEQAPERAAIGSRSNWPDPHRERNEMPATEAAQPTGIRDFEVSFPESDLAELRRRIEATRWPERETVDDDSQGVRLALMQD